MAKAKGVSSKTHSQKQLDDYANQHNPNNKAYKANADNHANQLNPKHKTHQQKHQAARKSRYYSLSLFESDYPDFYDFSG